MAWIFLSVVLVLIVFHRTFRLVTFTVGLVVALGFSLVVAVCLLQAVWTPVLTWATVGLAGLGLVSLVERAIWPSPARGMAPARPVPAALAPVWHPADTLPLLPWEPKTAAGKAYRERQLASRRAQGLALEL